MGNFWKRIGSVFAKIAVGAAKGAIWASDHPQVIAQVVGVAAAAGVKPGVIDKINAGVAISNTAVADGKAIASSLQSPPPPSAGSQG